MDILSIAIIVFCIMELGNVLILYFNPDSKLGNGVAVFDAWRDAKKDENLDLFAHYMAYWVAGVKLIFIFLLLVILITGTQTTKIFAVVAMILSIATYFWKLHPIIKQLDHKNKISPKGYSKTLGLMITGFLIMFSLALINYLFSILIKEVIKMHEMNLQEAPFRMIKNKTKTIELRLYDEKRRKIKPGDTIEFNNDKTAEILVTKVIALHIYKDFKELYKHFNKIEIGYEENEIPDPKDMEQYYAKEKIEKYGVVGIELKLERIRK